MTILRNKNFLGAVLVAAISVIYLIESRTLPAGTAAAPDTAYFPQLLGWGALLTCVAIALMAILSKNRDPGKSVNAADYHQGPVIIGLLLLIYPFFLSLSGFIPATLPLVCVCLWIMGYRKIVPTIFVAAIMSVVTYFLFAKALGVHLPVGSLFS